MCKNHIETRSANEGQTEKDLLTEKNEKKKQRKKIFFSQFPIEDHFILASDKATDRHLYILIRCLIEVINLTTALDPMITEIIAQRSTRT